MLVDYSLLSLIRLIRLRYHLIALYSPYTIMVYGVGSRFKYISRLLSPFLSEYDGEKSFVASHLCLFVFIKQALDQVPALLKSDYETL